MLRVVGRERAARLRHLRRLRQDRAGCRRRRLPRRSAPGRARLRALPVSRAHAKGQWYRGATRASLIRGLNENDVRAVGVQRPAEIANYGRLRTTPLVLAGVLAALAVATVTHALVASVRRRRRDFAILKTLGFARRQVSATVVWQASTMLVIALAVGLPLGVAAGRWAWTVVAEQLGTAAGAGDAARGGAPHHPRGAAPRQPRGRAAGTRRIPPEAGGRPAQRIASPSGLATCCVVGMQMWHMRIGRDTEAVAGKTLDRAVMRRVWRFARAYRRMLWAFLATIVLTSLVGILPPLVFKRIIDDAIPDQDLGQVNRAGRARRSAGARARRASRSSSAGTRRRIGEGLIFDLRVGAVRPRAAHADRVLHPHPDRRARSAA